MQDDAFVKKAVPTNEEFKREHTGSNKKITVGVPQQILKHQKSQSSYKGAIDESNALKSRTIKSSLKKSCDRTDCTADAQAKSATLPKDTDGDMSQERCAACCGNNVHQMWISRPLPVIH